VGGTMNNPKFLAAPCILALAACGGQIAGQEDDNTDDLSSSTYSMEMVRQNPALLPGVTPPPGVRVNGHPAPLHDHAQGTSFHGRHDESNWLYTANQLGQFLHLAEPGIHPDDQGDATYSRQPGDLFGDDSKLSWLDIEQGHLGDCYFAASIAAVLFADNGGSLTKSMIVPRVQSGKVVSYYATFFQASGRKVRIEVDPDLLHRNANGHVLYMRSTETKPGYEEWSPSLVEKAYATWHGSYRAIGNGGTAADGIYALTGKRTRFYSASDSKVIAAIEAAGKNGKAQVACTFGDNSGVKYPLGIYADHCYTLRGVRRAGSQVFVQLRNPWGPGAVTDPEPTEPPSADGVPDGLFDLPVADFAKLYNSVDIAP
jgi:hypothetical protein